MTDRDARSSDLMTSVYGACRTTASLEARQNQRDVAIHTCEMLANNAHRREKNDFIIFARFTVNFCFDGELVIIFPAQIILIDAVDVPRENLRVTRAIISKV